MVLSSIGDVEYMFERSFSETFHHPEGALCLPDFHSALSQFITAVSSPALIILGGCCCVLALLELQAVCRRVPPVSIICPREPLEILVGPTMQSKLPAIVGFQLNLRCKDLTEIERLCLHHSLTRVFRAGCSCRPRVQKVKAIPCS